MRKPTPFQFSILALTCWMLTSPAYACTADSMPPEELCLYADAIVRATAVNYAKEPEEVVGETFKYLKTGEIQFKIEEVVKGDNIPPNLIVRGFLSTRDDFNESPVPYRVIRPGGRGGCEAYYYKAGAEFLLFLKEGDGKLFLHQPSLTPVNEQLRSNEDPWLLWVKEFLKSQKKESGVARVRVSNYDLWGANLWLSGLIPDAT